MPWSEAPRHGSLPHKPRRDAEVTVILDPQPRKTEPILDDQFLIAMPNSSLDFCLLMRLKAICMQTGTNRRNSTAHCVSFGRHWTQLSPPQAACFGVGTV
jgi:hypothetical protein